mgnify:CR=1 FL=1
MAEVISWGSAVFSMGLDLYESGQVMSHDRPSITTATGAGSSCITHVCKKWISFADSLPYAWGLGATLVPIQEGG